jgi:hypothetical protein
LSWAGTGESFGAYGVRNAEEPKLSRLEQETIIRASALDRQWEVVTADPRIIRKLEKQGL